MYVFLLSPMELPSVSSDVISSTPDADIDGSSQELISSTPEVQVNNEHALSLIILVYQK